MAQKTRILVLNGPNLNLLGEREPDVYGSRTLEQINAILQNRAEQAGLELTCAQRNAEHELIELVQNARGQYQFIIINPAAYTHTSIALRDAFSAVQIPFIEVHLSNVHAREPFRRHSYLSDLATGVICGLGAQGYELALDYVIRVVQDN